MEISCHAVYDKGPSVYSVARGLSEWERGSLARVTYLLLLLVGSRYQSMSRTELSDVSLRRTQTHDFVEVVLCGIVLIGQ